MINRILILLFVVSSLYGQVTYEENFTDQQFNTDIWKITEGTESCSNKVKIADANESLQTWVANYAECTQWYSRIFQIIESSYPNTDIDFSGKIWRYTGVYGHWLSFRIFSDYTNYIMIEYNVVGVVRWSIVKDGVSVYVGQQSGYSNSSNRVYGIEYKGSTGKAKFYVRSSSESAKVYLGDTTQVVENFIDNELMVAYAAIDNAWGAKYYIDDIKITYTPISTFMDSFIFLSPLSGSYYSGGDTLNISWDATQDSISLVILGDTINVIGDNYDYIVPDSTFSLSIYGYLTNNPLINDFVNVNIKKTGKFIEVEEVNIPDLLTQNDELEISMKITSALIDSFKIFYRFGETSWSLFNYYIVDKDSTPNITNINFTINLSGQYGKLYLKAEEYRDTNSVIVPREYHKTGMARVPSKGVCYYYPTNILRTNWAYDPACGWNALAPYSGGTVLKVDNFVYPKYNPSYADTLNLAGYDNLRWFTWAGGCSSESGVEIRNNRICWTAHLVNIIQKGGYYLLQDFLARYHAITTYATAPLTYISPESSEFATVNQPTTYKGYYYYIDKAEGKVYVDDLVNGKNNILFCDYSDLFISSSAWVAPYFSSGNIGYAFSTFPFSKVYEHFEFTNFRWEIERTILDSLLADQIILDTYVPELRIVGGGYNNSISIPLLGEPPDISPLLYDVWGEEVESTVKNKRNYFRGIHPKIWKWGNIEGVKL